MRSLQMAVTSAGICFRRRLNNPKTYLGSGSNGRFLVFIFSALFASSRPIIRCPVPLGCFRSLYILSHHADGALAAYVCYCFPMGERTMATPI